MKIEDAYDFYFLSDSDNRYFFENKNEIGYEIKFKPFPYLFTNELFSTDTYEFIISVFSNPTRKTPQFDKNLGITISKIFDDFYQRNHKSITIYICDTSDSMQLARARKFSSWFLAFQNEMYLKNDAILLTKNNEKVPVSIILRRDNPFKYMIMEAFEMLTDGSTLK
jgi:Family of unknown function (DUF6169)